MKNTRKAIIAVLLALMTFVSCVLTGCTGKNEGETTNPPQQSGENTSDSSKPEESTDDTTEETTLGKPKDAETIGAIAIVDKAAYEYYNFVQSTADSFIGAINSAADKLSGKAQVYSVIAPTSIDITLDDATRASLNSSDQQKAINYLYGSMKQSVKVVDLYQTLRSHKDEYIYYRTDHHWTALGAYYGYVEFAKAAGFTPVDINKFEKVSYGEFLGSFYSDSKKSSKLEKNADELIAYKPNYSTKLTFTEKSGKTRQRQAEEAARKAEEEKAAAEAAEQKRRQEEEQRRQEEEKERKRAKRNRFFRSMKEFLNNLVNEEDENKVIQQSDKKDENEDNK